MKKLTAKQTAYYWAVIETNATAVGQDEQTQREREIRTGERTDYNTPERKAYFGNIHGARWVLQHHGQWDANRDKDILDRCFYSVQRTWLQRIEEHRRKIGQTSQPVRLAGTLLG